MTPSEVMNDYMAKKKKGKRLWWLKLPKDFFTSNNVIKKMRKLPGGDTYVVVTLKILLLALDHDFRIYYEGVEDTFVKDIALTLDETEESVAGALKVLIHQGWLVQEDEETLYSLKSEEMAGSESESAKRVRAFREKIKDKETTLLPLHCNESVTLEKRREEKRRKEIEEMLEGKDLATLYPDAFAEGKPKASPSISEIRGRAAIARFYAISPEDFFEIFSSRDWTVGGKEITDWACLYLCLESMARKASVGAE